MSAKFAVSLMMVSGQYIKESPGQQRHIWAFIKATGDFDFSLLVDYVVSVKFI